MCGGLCFLGFGGGAISFNCSLMVLRFVVLNYCEIFRGLNGYMRLAVRVGWM